MAQIDHSPVIYEVVDHFSKKGSFHPLLTAVVYGQVRDMCQQKDRICRTPVADMAAKIHVETSAFQSCLDELVSDKYLGKSISPAGDMVYEDLLVYAEMSGAVSSGEKYTGSCGIRIYFMSPEQQEEIVMGGVR